MDRNKEESGLDTEGAFEALLARQAMGAAPAGWRREILSRAQNARLPEPKHDGSSTNHRQPAGAGWLELLLARFPVAIAGLAAVWLFIWIGGAADRWLNGSVASVVAPVSREQVAEARAQRAELWQLAGFEDRVRETPQIAPPHRSGPPVLRPRSDRRPRPEHPFGLTWEIGDSVRA